MQLERKRVHTSGLRGQLIRGSLLRASPDRHILDQVDVAFDNEHALVAAGLLLQATLAERLGIEKLTGQLMDLGDRPARRIPAASCSAWSTPLLRSNGPSQEFGGAEKAARSGVVWNGRHTTQPIGSRLGTPTVVSNRQLGGTIGRLTLSGDAGQRPRPLTAVDRWRPLHTCCSAQHCGGNLKKALERTRVDCGGSHHGPTNPGDDTQSGPVWVRPAGRPAHDQGPLHLHWSGQRRGSTRLSRPTQPPRRAWP